ncbi:MAG: AI-2E family transporter [Leptospirales bacterium]|nr:AI-2E family transporter [Leptospirales bacterium]
MNRPSFLNREDAFPYLSILLLIGASLLLVWLFRSFVWPVFLAFVFYVAFESLHKRFLNLVKGRRNLAATMSMIGVLIIILGPIALLIRQLIIEAIDLGIRIKDLLASDAILQSLPHTPGFLDPVTSDPFFWVAQQETVLHLIDRYSTFLEPDKLGSFLGDASSFVLGSMAFTITLIANLSLALILLFFLFRDGDRFYEFAREVLPIPHDRLDIFVSKLNESLRAVVRGNLFVSILQGTAIAIGLYFCGISRGILFGAVAAVFSLIPIVGTSVVWLPAAAFLALVENSFGSAAFMAVYGPGMYLVLENIVKPKVLDRQLGVHPILLFFALLGGLVEFGITGVIIGPLLLTIFGTLWSIVPRRAPAVENSTPG